MVPLTDRRYPAWETHDAPHCAASFLVSHSDETVRAADLLRARLRRVLRDRDGTSYDVAVAAEALDGQTMHVVLTVDGVPARVVASLEEVIGSLAADGPTDHELEYHRALYLRSLDDPARGPVDLERVARAALCGWPAPTTGHDRFPLCDDSAQAVAAAVRAAAANALLVVPRGVPVPVSLASPMERPASSPVRGRTFRPSCPMPSSPPVRLIVSSAGATWTSGPEQVTVKTDDIAAALVWSDGTRQLISRQGATILIDPRAWVGPSSELRGLYEATPRDLVVPMGDRSRPQPPRRSLIAFDGRTSLLVLGAAVLWLLTVIMWTGVLSNASDTNHNVLGPLMFTGLSVVVTLSLRDRLAMIISSRRKGFGGPDLRTTDPPSHPG